MMVDWIQSPWTQPFGRRDLDEDPPRLVDLPFEAWKASAARSGARRALEFVKAWYLELSLDQLATWRQEADTELEAVRPAII